MKLTTKERKKRRVRSNLKKVSSKERYRLSVSRSSKNISAQIIDDKNHKTLVAASSFEKKLTKTSIMNKISEKLVSKRTKESKK